MLIMLEECGEIYEANDLNNCVLKLHANNKYVVDSTFNAHLLVNYESDVYCIIHVYSNGCAKLINRSRRLVKYNGEEFLQEKFLFPNDTFQIHDHVFIYKTRHLLHDEIKSFIKQNSSIYRRFSADSCTLQASNVIYRSKNDLSLRENESVVAITDFNISGMERLCATPDSTLPSEASLENQSFDVLAVKDEKNETEDSAFVNNTPISDVTNFMYQSPKRSKSPKNDSISIAEIEPLLTIPKLQNRSENDLTNIADTTKLFQTSKHPKSPKNDLSNIVGVKALLKTPKVQKGPENDLTHIVGTKKLFQTPKCRKSPENDLTNVVGVKTLLKTPKVQKGPENDLSNIVGTKKLFGTPKCQKSPENDLTKIVGVKTLLKTPKVQRGPENDLTNIVGTKKLFQTPKCRKSPENDLTNVVGVKTLLKTPKVHKGPENDLSNIVGTKKLFGTPKCQKSPENDLTKIVGVKTLLKTPKVQREPKNDLTNIAGVKQLFKSPKATKSPLNDLQNIVCVKTLFCTPKVQIEPENDLTNVSGTRKLFETPKARKSPENDLRDVAGVKRMFCEEEAETRKELNVSGVNLLMNQSDASKSFDELLDKKPLKFYQNKKLKTSSSRESLSSNDDLNKSNEKNEEILKWMSAQKEKSSKSLRSDSDEIVKSQSEEKNVEASLTTKEVEDDVKLARESELKKIEDDTHAGHVVKLRSRRQNLKRKGEENSSLTNKKTPKRREKVLKSANHNSSTLSVASIISDMSNVEPTFESTPALGYGKKQKRIQALTENVDELSNAENESVKNVRRTRKRTQQSVAEDNNTGESTETKVPVGRVTRARAKKVQDPQLVDKPETPQETEIVKRATRSRKKKPEIPEGESDSTSKSKKTRPNKMLENSTKETIEVTPGKRYNTRPKKQIISSTVTTSDADNTSMKKKPTRRRLKTNADLAEEVLMHHDESNQLPILRRSQRKRV